MPKETDTKSEKRFRDELASQLLTLATAGFGFVAALAWNETILGIMKEFIEPRIPGSGLFSKFIYALLITIIAVTVTYQLTKLSSKIQPPKES